MFQERNLVGFDNDFTRFEEFGIILYIGYFGNFINTYKIN